MLLVCLLFLLEGFGQDNCADATVFNLPNNGFDPADIKSADIDITVATKEAGENFAAAISAAGQDQKSIWFKFTIATTRSVTISLGQSGSTLLNGDVGFAVYKSNTCLPAISQLSSKLTPLTGFGSRSNNCVEAGTYLVQVSAKIAASGTVYLLLQTSLPDPSSFDNTNNAYDFGIVTSTGASIAYDIDCQAIDDPTETCSLLPNPQEYTKSTWHVFTTPPSNKPIQFSLTTATAAPGATIGFLLYKGNARISALTPLGNCEALVTDNFRSAYKTFGCTLLQPNTVYSILLFFHSDFSDNIQLNLSAKEPVIQTTNVPLCNAASYTLPWGEVVSTGGSYKDTLKAAGGCDSLIRIMNVSFFNTLYKKDTIELCGGKSYTLPWGAVVTKPGIYGDTISYSYSNCDSLIYTVLIREPAVPVIYTSVTACPGFGYTLPWGQVVTVSGLYADTLLAGNGCDSLIKQVRVNFTNSYDIRFGTDSTCAGQVYTLPWGATATVGGTYFDTVRRANGCDSIIYMFTLKVKSVTMETDTVIRCSGSSYTLPWGVVVDTPGIYSDTIRYAGKLKCDSLVRHIDLSFGTPETQIINATLCENGNYTLPWGQTVMTPGVYKDTIKAMAGCDSLVREVRLAFQMLINRDTSVTICEGNTYTLPWGGTATTQGVYTNTITGAGGCDSLKWVVNLIVQTLKRDTAVFRFCAGQSFTLPWGTVVDSAGIYLDTIKYDSGCDSLVRVVNLIAAPVQVQDSLVSVCSGDSFVLPWGTVVTTPGSYNDTLRSGGGCDSLIRSFRVSFKTPVIDSKDVQICSGNYQLPWGPVVSYAGIYRDTLRYTTGCDSLISIVNLTVGAPIIINEDTTICAGQSFVLPNGVIVTSTGKYADTIRSSGGCDSLIYITNLFIGAVQKDSLMATFCNGSSYTLPWGVSVTAAGVYRDTTYGNSGCDSLIQIVDLRQSSPENKFDSVSMCSGETYTLPWGDIVNSEGFYRDTIRSMNGCDSVIAVVRVTFKSVLFQTGTVSICSGSTYTLPWGPAVNIPGVYNDTLRYNSGCDSLVRIINLIVGSPLVESMDTTICAGQVFALPGGVTVSAPGVYRDTILSSGGCDSLIFVTTVSIQAVKRDTLRMSFCSSGSYVLPWGQSVTQPGIYEDTIRTLGGCDSLIQRAELTGGNVRLIRDSIGLCSGTMYTLPWGPVVDSTGIYADTLRYSNGCDSVIHIVKLLELAPLTQTIQASFCTGSAYTLPWGIAVNAPGIYADTIRYAAGCDSLVRTVDLQLNRVAQDVDTVGICPGQVYTLPWGTVVNTEGSYRDTLKANGGCDSLIRIVTVRMANPLVAEDTAYFCPGTSYTLPWGAVATTQGIYRDTIRYTSGCDSLIQVVHVNQSTSPGSQTIEATLCSGQSYTLPSGLIVASPGTYSDTLKAAGGCDSIVVTAIIYLIPATVSIIDTTICNGDQYTLSSGLEVTTTGVYMDTIKASGGCDSLIKIITLTVNETGEQTTNVNISNGETYTLPWGQSVTIEGTYRDTLHYQSGCDSVIRTVNLVVGDLPLLSTAASFCSGGTFTLPWGETVNQPGIYRDTIKTNTGRDSLINEVLLTNRSAQIQRFSAAVCDGSSYMLPWGTVVSEPGTYSDTLQATDGCDSLIRIVNISTDAAPLLVITKSNDINCTLNSAQLTANGGLAYKWWPAESLSNATIADPIASPLVTTTYYVQVTSASGCQVMDSIRVYVTADDLNKGYLVPNAFTPGNDGKNDCFGVRHWGSVTELSFTIYDRWGGIIFQTTDPSRCWDGTRNGQQLPTATFVYFIKAKTLCGPVVRKGTVTLVR